MNADRINEHYYGEPADPRTERARARVHWMCGQASGRDVLDIGCSQGIVSLILGREGFHCTGVDLEKASLAVAEAALLKEDPLVQRHVKFQVADASSLPFDAESFDTVILGEILEHLTHPGKVLREALRVLRNGGRLVVTVPFGLNAFHDHKQTYYPLTLLELIQPLLRTETIDTLNNYILYSGVKEASYTPGTVSPDERWLTALRLHRLVEDRCLQKERELLGSATEFHKQLKALTTQSTAQRQAIEELETELKNRETALKNREQEVAELRTLTSKLKRTAEDARQAAASTQQTHSGEIQAAQANAARLEAQARELESQATSSRQRIDELTRLLEQTQAATVAVQELAKHAELEHSRRLQDLATQSVSQATTIQALELTVTNKDLRIQDLSASLEQAHASLLESRSASEDLRQTHAAQVHELTDRIREQSATLDHLQHLLRVQDQRITESKAACEETREKLLTATSSLSQLQQEFLNSQASVRELQANRDAQQSQFAAHAAELQAKDDERRRELESLATRHARDIRAREIQIRDLNALLAARDKEHQRELEATTKKRDVDWERRLMNQRIRALVRDKLPADAHILVISKGDEELLRLDGRHGEHFPQTAEGIYAGHHPGSSQEAIQHLESLRGKGARYLLVPQTSFWWLEFYREFREHLDTHARLITFDETTGALYQLEPPPSEAPVYATVAARKNGATEKIVKARPQRPQIPAPARTVPKPVQRAAPEEPPQIGVILDEFTMGCLAPECHLLTFRPDNWRQKLEARPPRALFVESAWRGNEGAWLYRVAQYSRDMGNELSELLHWARDQKIPSVFWNKEDPVHFERFIERAKLFSHVFTTDADCIPRYQEQLKHDRVFALPFAAQPAIHNPIHDGSRQGMVCFAGTYYGNRHEQRQIDMDYILRPAISFGLEIYDRQYGLTGKEAEAYRFPDIYRSCIKGRLDYEDMVRAYRNYRVFLNVNSVKQSPTMFSRRVFELLACGTPVISTYSRGIVDLLGEDVVFITETEADTRLHLERLLGSEDFWARASTKGIRKVMQTHTYHHRLRDVFNRTGLELIPPRDPRISLVLRLDAPADLEALAPMLSSQTYRHFDLIMLTTTPLPAATLDAFRNSLPTVRLTPCVAPAEAQFAACHQASSADYWAFMDPADHYGPDYLMDYALAIQYSEAQFLGKHTHFAQTGPATSLAQPGGEHRWVFDVPSATLLARKSAIVPEDFRRALNSLFFQNQRGPILSIDRFNYLRHDPKNPGNLNPARRLPGQLQEIAA